MNNDENGNKIRVKYQTCWKDGPQNRSLKQDISNSGLKLISFDYVLNDYSDYKYVIELEINPGEENTALDIINKFDFFNIVKKPKTNAEKEKENEKNNQNDKEDFPYSDEEYVEDDFDKKA